MGSKSSSVLQEAEIKIISSETGFSASQIGKLHSRFCQLDKKNRGFIGKDEFLSIPELAANPMRDRLLNAMGALSQAASSDQPDGIDFVAFIKNLAVFLDVWTGSKQMQEPSQDQSTNQRVRVNHPVKSKTNNEIKANDNNSKINNNNHTLLMTAIKSIAPTEGIDLLKFNPVFNRWDNKYQLNGVLIEETKRAKLLFLFKLYDNDNDGRISFIDLRGLIKTLVGDCMDDIELDKIALRAFVEVDEHSDGFINFGEFCQVLEGKDLDNKFRVKFFH